LFAGALAASEVLGSRFLRIERSFCRVENLNGASGPGNVLMIVIESEAVTEVISGFGEKGVSCSFLSRSPARGRFGP
jgi:RNA 3'-terminal phosphate cyclase